MNEEMGDYFLENIAEDAHNNINKTEDPSVQAAG